jgi:hypothetical protein
MVTWIAPLSALAADEIEMPDERLSKIVKALLMDCVIDTVDARLRKRV